MYPPLNALIRDTDRLVGQYESREANRKETASKVAELTQEVSTLTMTDAALTALLTQTSAANLKAIEELVTSGLQAIFDDLALSFHFQVSTERNQQSLTPVLASHGLAQGPILGSHGGGPAQVVALLLRILSVHRLGLHPLVVLDESLNMLSDQYISNCATFLKGLSARMGITLLLVTHKPAFADEASRAYEIASSPGGAVFKDVTRV